MEEETKNRKKRNKFLFVKLKNLLINKKDKGERGKCLFLYNSSVVIIQKRNEN